MMWMKSEARRSPISRLNSEKTEELMRDALASPDKAIGVRLSQHRKKDGSTFSVEITCRIFPLRGSSGSMQLLLADPRCL